MTKKLVKARTPPFPFTVKVQGPAIRTGFYLSIPVGIMVCEEVEWMGVDGDIKARLRLSCVS